MTRLEKYRQQHAAILTEMEAILTAAETQPDGALTEEQDTQYQALRGRKTTLESAIKREDEHETAERAAPARASAPASGDPPPRIETRPRAEDDPRRGFASHRDFLLSAIENSGLRDRAQVQDERLRPLAVMDAEDKRSASELAFLLPRAFNPSFLAAAGSDEQGGYDDRYGGFAVGRTLLPRLLQVGFEGDPTAGRTQSLPMATPIVDIPARVDKDHSSSVSGGFTVTRKPETVAATATRAQLEMVSMKATSLFGLAYATEEIIVDSVISFVAIIDSGFRTQFAAHMLNEKLRGKGGNEYLGPLTALAASGLGPTISIAKESGQAADTVVANNVLKMRARCWGYAGAIWLANHDTYPQLATLQIPVGTGGQLIYQQSIQEDRPDMLLGRPIFYTEYASTLGDQGDLILGNWSEYLDGLYQPLQSAESMHVRFVNHERTFKFWLRNAGAPWWRSALTPAKSSDTLSPFVVLNARA